MSTQAVSGVRVGCARLSLALAVFVFAPAGAAERWATTIGYEPQHVIVDSRSTDASRLEQTFPGRPRPRPQASDRIALNNVGVQVSAVLAALTGPNAPAGVTTHPNAAEPGAQARAVAVSGTQDGVTGVPAYGPEDTDSLTLRVAPSGALRTEDRERVHAFLAEPALVLTADSAGRNAMADALDAVAPAGRDVIVREDAARVRPGTVRLERRAP